MIGVENVTPNVNPIVVPAPHSDTTRWYAAYTCTNHERRVAQQLAERQVESFLPVYRSVRRWKDRRKELQLALFPSYVFVHMDVKERLKVLQLPGVVNLVSFGGVPAPLADREIESLRTGLMSHGRVESHPYLAVGKRVRIVDGPFAGIEGIVLRRKDKLRVVLSISLIQRSVAIDVSESDIAPIYR